MTIRSKRSHEGYLLIDNRNAPPVPSFSGSTPEMTPAIAAGATFESATVTCSHCHRVVVLNPGRTRERHYCPKCDHYICDWCEAARVASGGDCVPFNKKLEARQEQAARQPDIVLTDTP